MRRAAFAMALAALGSLGARGAATRRIGRDLNVTLRLTATRQEEWCRGGGTIAIAWQGRLADADPKSPRLPVRAFHTSAPLASVARMEESMSCAVDGMPVVDYRLERTSNATLDLTATIVDPSAGRLPDGVVSSLILSGRAGRCRETSRGARAGSTRRDATLMLGIGTDEGGAQATTSPAFGFGRAPFAAPFSRTFAVTGTMPGPCGGTYDVTGTLRVSGSAP